MDICGGAEDIARGVVRCVGEPDRRFQEDGLRILRALRFASVLGFQIAPETASAIHRNAALLQYLAAERVQSELTKLLCGQNVGAVLREFADVLAVPIPELRPMFGFEQHNPHHDRDVWQHTAAVVAHIPAGAVLRWRRCCTRSASRRASRSAGRCRAFLRHAGQEHRAGGRYPYAPAL